MVGFDINIAELSGATNKVLVNYLIMLHHIPILS
jgi:hypothetical protein